MRIRPVTIRRPTPADDAFVAELAEEAFSAWSHDPRRSVGRMVERAGAAAVATIEERPVGLAILSFTELGHAMGPWEAPRVARVDAIATVRKGRRRGVGTALMAWAERESRGVGAVVMRLCTAETNKSARRLFYREGFMAILRSPDAYSNGEAGIEMFKALVDEAS